MLCYGKRERSDLFCSTNIIFFNTLWGQAIVFTLCALLLRGCREKEMRFNVVNYVEEMKAK